MNRYLLHKKRPKIKWPAFAPGDRFQPKDSKSKDILELVERQPYSDPLINKTNPKNMGWSYVIVGNDTTANSWIQEKYLKQTYRRV